VSYSAMPILGCKGKGGEPAASRPAGRASPRLVERHACQNDPDIAGLKIFKILETARSPARPLPQGPPDAGRPLRIARYRGTTPRCSRRTVQLLRAGLRAMVRELAPAQVLAAG
jgi:hypothetical protein